MQHGTGREVVIEAIENAMAVLDGFSNTKDVVRALSNALDVLDYGRSLDTPGVYGPDYGRLKTGQQQFGPDYGVNIPEVQWKVKDGSSYTGPVGSIRDTRPDDLGRVREIDEANYYPGEHDDCPVDSPHEHGGY